MALSILFVLEPEFDYRYQNHKNAGSVCVTTGCKYKTHIEISPLIRLGGLS